MKKRYKYRKISPNDVKEIKKLVGKLTHKEIAEKFGIHRNTLLYHLNPEYKKDVIKRAKKSRAKLTKEELREREKKYLKRKREYYNKRYQEDEAFRKRHIRNISKWQKKKRKTKVKEVSEKGMEWIIVGFNHPEEKKSKIYRQNITEELLIKAIKDGIEKGCNVFSIRGFKK